MNGLKDIRDDIQNIAEAMLSVLNIDVTIVDEHLERIAGTGTYLEKIGINIISEYEIELKDYLISRLKILKNIEIYNPEANTGLLTFNIKGVYGSDAGKWFNANGIAVRTGQHCTRLLIDEFQTDSTIRVSLYFYNTFEEIDKFIEVCRRATRDNIYNLIFNNSKENKNV